MTTTGIDACKEVRELTDTAFLGFSGGGKDSIATWLRVREYFPRVIPIFHYWLPGLEFVEKALGYYENFFDTKVVRLPHPGLSQMLRYGSFQPPHRYQICEWWNLADADFREQANWIAEDKGIADEDAWMAVGLRSADSVRRLMYFQKYGTVNHRQRKFHPIAEMRKPELVEMIRASGVKLAPEYAVMPRSFDGFTIDYLRPIKEKFPRDYERIRDWFPMVEAEHYRMEVFNDAKG